MISEANLDASNQPNPGPRPLPPPPLLDPSAPSQPGLLPFLSVGLRVGLPWIGARVGAGEFLIRWEIAMGEQLALRLLAGVE